jgi:hypothetical protein
MEKEIVTDACPLAPAAEEDGQIVKLTETAKKKTEK